MIHNLKTIGGKDFIVTSNEQKRTFTIYKDDTKYTTNKMTKLEFNENIHNTGKDWQNYLLTSNDYYKVK
jgi:hypothetical protein